LGALEGTLSKAIQGSAGGRDTWGTRGCRKGTPITQNKNIHWGIREERTSGDGEQELSAPNPMHDGETPIERGTKLHETLPAFPSPFVDHRNLALAAVSCPALVPHLLQFLFSILFLISLVNPSRHGQLRGAFLCNIDSAEFAAEIAVQFCVGYFFILGDVQRILLNPLWRWPR